MVKTYIDIHCKYSCVLQNDNVRTNVLGTMLVIIFLAGTEELL